ncbi:MAG TPA: 2-amino-4-hydroxy-6-hydroxymethyldihydropteridine diphosphokinase [Micromonosporaceae bacterium]|nr:2-amino-4-hydroxy-6-hydroxymethyldihydropteridine diphosphokinase [Micromonosporaceae bacterium]
MTKSVLALGSNLGDRAGYLRGAVAALDEWLLVVSGVYETPPWPPGAGGPPYLNAVLLVHDASATPRDWLDRARACEERAGRVRDPADRNAPRTLDVDVVAVWTDDDTPVLSDDPELTLPHPRAHLRAFVLRPWIDIQPYARLPGHGPLTDLLRAPEVAADLADVRARGDVELESAQ